MQAKTLLLQPLQQHRDHPSWIVFPLEDQNGVIGVSDLGGPPPQPRLHFVLEPLVHQHFMQVVVAASTALDPFSTPVTARLTETSLR